MPTPEEKIQILRRSLRCYLYGLLSLLPILGLAFSIVAIGSYFGLSKMTRDGWNPAQRYAFRGYVLALVGVLIGVIALGACFFAYV